MMESNPFRAPGGPLPRRLDSHPLFQPIPGARLGCLGCILGLLGGALLGPTLFGPSHAEIAADPDRYACGMWAISAMFLGACGEAIISGLAGLGVGYANSAQRSARALSGGDSTAHH
jgi:hypothetical protein